MRGGDIMGEGIDLKDLARLGMAGLLYSAATLQAQEGMDILRYIE